MRSVRVLVVGGGASGMVAAITAKRSGASVLVLEKKNRLGKKLLATGNGKCNFTNQVQYPECYRSSQTEYPWKVMEQFGWEDSVVWFDEIGILAKSREGYIYPASGQAASVLHALEREMKRLKIEVHTEEEAVHVAVSFQKKEQNGFVVTTEKAEYLAQNVILSTGGMAAPVHGSTGDGYRFAKELGHHLVAPVPALTSLILEGSFMKGWSGIRIQGKVALYDEKEHLLGEDVGEIQMVAYGISGIPVFQLSRFAAREINEGRRVTLYLDSMPEYDRDWIVQELFKRQKREERQSMRDLLEGMLPDKFAGVCLKHAKISDTAVAGEVSGVQLARLADVIKSMRLKVKAVSGFDKAQVTAGGVCTSEVNPDTMESLLCKGLYLTGELLDVDGICGGYNLQWAWTTGYLAGSAAGACCCK